MAMGSKLRLFFTFLFTACTVVFTSTSIQAQSISSPPADLLGNEKVIYILPEVGSILPDSPLFVLKQLRDDVLLVIPQDTLSKMRLLIQLGDKYTVYADKMAHSSKSKLSASLFDTALDYQNEVVNLLSGMAKSPQKDEKALSDYKNIATQSSIKQAETIRLLLGEVPSSEQSLFIQLLDRNILLRKKLQAI